MSRRLKKEKIDLLTTDLYYRVLVRESVLRFSFTKDLLVEDEPARDRGKPFPLSNIAVKVGPIAAVIDEKDKINVQGSFGGKALFYSKNEVQEIAWPDEEFYKETVLREVQPGMEISAQGRVVFCSEEGPPLEAEGKLLYQVHIGIEVLLAVVDPRQLTVAVGAKDIAPERVSRGVLAATELVSESSLHFDVAKEIGFAGDVGYARVVNCFLQGFSYEWGPDVLDLKGELVIAGFVLAGGKGSLPEIRERFSRQLPFPEQKKEGLQLSLFPSIGAATCMGDGKNVHYHVTIDVWARVTREVRQEVISDIQEAAVKKEYLLLPRAMGIVREPLELVQKLAFAYPQEIAAGPCRFLSLEVSPQEDRLSVSGSLEKNVYYYPAAGQALGGQRGGTREEEWEETGEGAAAGAPAGDAATEPAAFAGEAAPAGETAGKEAAFLARAEVMAGEPGLPYVLKVEDDFLSDLYLPGIGAMAETAVYLQPQGTEYVSTENDTLQLSHILLEIKAWEAQEMAVVVPSRVPPGTSMVIYAVRAGDTLLKVGRAYGLKPEVIAAANGLEEDAGLEAGQRLLVPLMHFEDD